MTKLSIVASSRDRVGDDGRRALLHDIGALIARARSYELEESVFLLNMVYLDLQTKIHDIDDEELEAFSKIVRSSIAPL